MADHISDGDDMAAHRQTYDGFVRGAVVIALASAFTLVGLCNFAFGSTASLLMGFGGIIVGHIAIGIDALSGSRTFTLSLILLLAYGIVTAINVS